MAILFILLRLINTSGFYPTPSGISAFQQELAGYKHAKGSVQFPIDDPMPLALIDATGVDSEDREIQGGRELEEARQKEIGSAVTGQYPASGTATPHLSYDP
jgi:hypothetical protein